MNRPPALGDLLFGDGDPFLRRPDGSSFDPDELPCTDLPHLWDYDALPTERAHAKHLCVTECPALDACRRRRRELKTGADGVWAGVAIRRPTRTEPYDPTTLAWSQRYGVPLPPATR